MLPSSKIGTPYKICDFAIQIIKHSHKNFIYINMELKNICFKKITLSYFRKLIKNYFSNCKVDEKIVFLECKKYEQYYIEHNLDTTCKGGLFAIFMYLVSKNVVDNNLNNDDLIDVLTRAKLACVSVCTNYISPYSNISFPLIITGCFNYIGGGYNLGENVVIGNNNRFYDNNITLFDKKINIGKNVKVCDDCKIYTMIGEDCVINNGCVIREKISDNTVVELKNNIQVKTALKSTVLPSQNLMCYGCVPKYKNTLVIYGEGFYNPKLKFVVPYGEVDFSLSYWDKDKIIIKINDVKMLKDDGRVTLILFSRGQRISIINDLGVQKVLKNLKK